MKQVVMVGPRKSKVVDVPVPEINDNQLLVRVTYTGMCHSEWYPWTIAQPGELFGHESVGVVARCGRNVTGFREGDRVTGLGGGGLREFIVMEPESPARYRQRPPFRTVNTPLSRMPYRMDRRMAQVMQSRCPGGTAGSCRRREGPFLQANQERTQFRPYHIEKERWERKTASSAGRRRRTTPSWSI